MKSMAEHISIGHAKKLLSKSHSYADTMKVLYPPLEQLKPLVEPPRPPLLSSSKPPLVGLLEPPLVGLLWPPLVGLPGPPQVGLPGPL